MDNGPMGEKLLYNCTCRCKQWQFLGSYVQRYILLIIPLIKFPHLVVNKRMLLLLAGTQYAQQSYKVSDSFPFKWINKKWREGFYVTAMATAGTRWAVVMSRNAGFTDQVI
jgi:hypothetical protein